MKLRKRSPPHISFSGDIPVEILTQLLEVDAHAGKLYWKERPLDLCGSAKSQKIFNSTWAGKEAFTATDKVGYKVGSIMNRMYKAHRMIWALHYGKHPEMIIDHIDRCVTNNSISNLRDVPQSINALNRGASSHNACGLKGVCLARGGKRWRANIKINGSQTYIGTFDTPEEAFSAYKKRAIEVYGQFATF